MPWFALCKPGLPLAVCKWHYMHAFSFTMDASRSQRVRSIDLMAALRAETDTLLRSAELDAELHPCQQAQHVCDVVRSARQLVDDGIWRMQRSIPHQQLQRQPQVTRIP